MTIGAWILFAVLAVVLVAVGIVFALGCETKAGAAVTIIAAIFLCVALLFGMLWYFHNTASGKRALTDQRSELNNGLERTITVYTADGQIIAQYSGKIDIAESEGGYIKFDFDGKRYIYYNCFVESVADIG